MILEDNGFLDIKYCEDNSALSKKITSIIATSQCPINVMMCSVFSLLIRSNPEFLEHVIVSINGPDKRTGSTQVQDKKQSFFEELRSLTWHGKDMPLTVIRAWSRLGHAQAIEMGIPWVHTQFYHLMHDDVIVLKDWTDLSAFDQDPKLCIVGPYPLFNVFLDSGVYKGENKLGFANLNTSFLLCNKSILNKLGTRWIGYHLQDKFEISDQKSFVEYHASKNNIAQEKGVQVINHTLDQTVSKQFSYVNVDIGGAVFYRLIDAGYSLGLMQPDVSLHIGGQSWNKNDRFIKSIGLVRQLEKDLFRYPDYWHLYKKYYES